MFCRGVGGRSGREGAGWPLHGPVKTGIWKALLLASHVSQVDTQQAAPNPLHASAHTNTGGEKRQTRKAHANTAAQKLTRHRLRCWPLTHSLSCVRGSSHQVGSSRSRLSVHFLQLLTRRGLALEMCWWKISIESKSCFSLSQLPDSSHASDMTKVQKRSLFQTKRC